MKVFNGYQVRHRETLSSWSATNEKHGIFPVRSIPSAVKKPPKGIISISYCIFDGILALSDEIDSSVGKFKGRVVGYREYHSKERFIPMGKKAVRAVKDIRQTLQAPRINICSLKSFSSITRSKPFPGKSPSCCQRLSPP